MNNILITKENCIDKYINNFINYIDVKERTIETYKTALKQFSIFLNGNNIINPQREDIINYRKYLISIHKPTTVNGYLIAVRNFFDWLEYEGIYKNISKKVKGISVSNDHKREALTIEQCKSILDNTSDMRERTIFLLTVSCGIRANELVNIRISDFQDKQGNICLYLLGKGRDYKEDFVIIPTDIYSLVKEYIDEYGITDYLFVSNSNHSSKNGLSTGSVRRIVKGMFKKIGLDSDKYVFHSLRHTFATISIMGGRDIREVSQALRHKNLSTSEIYLHDLEKINNKCSNSVSNAIVGGLI